MSGPLTDPDFKVRYPTFAENLTLQQAPPRLPSNPWGIPSASVGNKVQESQTNPNARSYVHSVPFFSNWEANYSTGMPLFVNAKKATASSPSVLAATPAVVNYYLEEGARTLNTAMNTAQKRKQSVLIEDYCSREHLYCDNLVEKFLSTWRHYGYIYSIMGKGSESGLTGSSRPADELIFNCTVYKTADILNYWGHVNDGDRIGWALGLKKNIYPYFYDPNGNSLGLSSGSPEYFLQLVPVVCGAQGYSAAHNKNWKDPENPNREDIDFMYRNMTIEQEDLIMNMETGVFTNAPLDLTKETMKVNKLGADIYAFGAFYPVGVVNKGSRTTRRPNRGDLDMALRSNPKAQTLERIQVFLGC
jgi:hypothetical protein